MHNALERSPCTIPIAVNKCLVSDADKRSTDCGVCRLKVKHGWYLGPKRDYSLTGRLTLRIDAVPGHGRRTWRDGAKQRLEEQIGSAVVGIEDAARRCREARIAEEQRQAEVKEKRRAVLVEALHERHDDALGDDLVVMARRWSEAQALRGFIGAAATAVPVEQRSPEFAAWLEWATAYVGEIDPTANPDDIANSLVPDATGIPEPTGDWGWAPPSDEEWKRAIRLRAVRARREAF